MSTNDVLEVGKILGSIVGVWFALVGWKLVPQNRTIGPRSGASAPVPPRR